MVVLILKSGGGGWLGEMAGVRLRARRLQRH